MKYLGTIKLETNRLILRKINHSDYKQAFKNWCSSDIITKYLLWETHKDENETQEIYEKIIERYSNNKTFEWIIELKETKEVIGTINISPKYLQFGVCKVGYCIGEKFWNKGYATEACTAVIKFLFEKCDARCVIGEYFENNKASGRVMEKCGLKYETRLRKRVIDKTGKINDLIIYLCSNEEYRN